MEQTPPSVIQIVGYKKTGKTTLICRLIERFTSQGLLVGAVKHDGHEFEPDVPDTDSWLLRRAGASAAAVVSARRTAFFEERGAQLGEVLMRMSGYDLVFIEGWKRAAYPKLALVQTAEQLPLLSGLTELVAVITWNTALREAIIESTKAPVIEYDDIEQIAEIVGSATDRTS